MICATAERVVDNFDAATAGLAVTERDALRRSYVPQIAELPDEFREEGARGFHWMSDLEQRAIPAEQVVDAVLAAVADPPVDSATWAAACEVLEHLGKRADIARFEPNVPDTPEARAAFAGAVFDVRHRSLS